MRQGHEANHSPSSSANLLPVILYGCENWCLTLWKNINWRRLRAEHWVYLDLKRKKQDQTGEHSLVGSITIYPKQTFIRTIKSGRTRRLVHVAWMGIKVMCTNSGRKSWRKYASSVGSASSREDNIRQVLRKRDGLISCGSRQGLVTGFSEYSNEPVGFYNMLEIFSVWATCTFLSAF
jgi:hypothetical protein